MLLNKCKHFDAIDHLKNNILHYACVMVRSKRKTFFIIYESYLE
jgi:hypothetical protein